MSRLLLFRIVAPTLEGGTMGAVKHLKTLCCLGLPPESAMVADGRIVYETSGLELLLRILTGEPSNYTRYVPVSDRLPAPVLKLAM
jgi:hypothetical protein